MLIRELGIPVERIPGAIRAFRGNVDQEGWTSGAAGVRAGAGRLVALWGADRRDLGEGLEIWGVFELADGLACLRQALPGPDPGFEGIEEFFPAAGRMQRSIRDLLGMSARGSRDGRPWLRHGAWPPDTYPLRRGEPDRVPPATDGAPYAFVSVAGEGVHEIPVGPVHAGTIEPGHFRFSVLGERVMRLEARLGYKHKGIEKRFEMLTVQEGAALAGRVSGDSTVAYAWAYAMAVEGCTEVSAPSRSIWLRAFALERERVANHLGDLGFIGNDAGLGFALAQFSRLREDWLRLNERLFGHRLLMDLVVPGGVTADLDMTLEREIRLQLDAIETEVTRMRGIFAEHPGLQDRLQGCGRVPPALADSLGLIGLAGRASGQYHDLRVRHPVAPYDELRVNLSLRETGDVAARVEVRFDEIAESLRLLLAILDRIPGGDTRIACPQAAPGAIGTGWVEGWRGEVFVFLECGTDGRIRRCHPHDPSWQNWPLLEHAVPGNIVPDFPLINKSFNLGYSGVDL